MSPAEGPGKEAGAAQAEKAPAEPAGTAKPESRALPELALRCASGAALGAAGLYAVWEGGAAWFAIVALACSAIVWETARMLDPGLGHVRGLAIATACAGALWLNAFDENLLMPLALAVPLLLGCALVRRGRARFFMFGLWAMAAAVALVELRELYGPLAAAWLLGTAVASDVAGYAVGKTIGGPKIMPKISPGKTWSGTVGGWVAALGVAEGFHAWLGTDRALLFSGLALCLAAQAGDLAQSALKRSAGAKNSSGVIPGHGGVYDRLDSVVGAATLAALLHLLGLLGWQPL